MLFYDMIKKTAMIPMAKPKKYKISLTDDELKMLKSVMRKNKTTKTVRNRCQIIIDLDEAHGKNPLHMNKLLKQTVSVCPRLPIQ
mgnify:CR=1 FL=1